MGASVAGQGIFFVGLLGIGGYVGYSLSNYDPTEFQGTKAEIQTSLAKAETVLPRKTKDGFIRIWSAGRTSKGVKLAMRYADWAPTSQCEALVEQLTTETVSVKIDCGSAAVKGSAIADTTHALKVPMFEEHVQSVLRQRAFNRDFVDSKQAGIAMSNMGGMQREALKTADEVQAMQQNR